MSKIILIIMALISTILILSTAQAQPSASWLDATAETRAAIAALQAQAQAQKAQQAEAAYQQNQQLLESLDTIATQQKAIIENATQGTAQSTVPDFQAKPRTPAASNNPWLKTNPWKNSQQNPYSGQQYAPSQPDYTNNGVYVKPNSSEKSQTTSQQPVNIFR